MRKVFVISHHGQVVLDRAALAQNFEVSLPVSTGSAFGYSLLIMTERTRDCRLVDVIVTLTDFEVHPPVVCGQSLSPARNVAHYDSALTFPATLLGMAVSGYAPLAGRLLSEAPAQASCARHW